MSDDTMTVATFSLPSAPSSCSEARRHILNTLVDVPDDVRDLAVLLTSELVSNAIMHAVGPVTLTIELDETLIRMEVADAGTMPPTVKPYGPESATGRGLRLLDVLADQWGWNPSDSGKTVWFELSTVARAVTGASRGMKRPTEPLAVDPYPSGVLIVLMNAPVQAMIRSGACYDALYRRLTGHADHDELSTRDDGPQGLLSFLKNSAPVFAGQVEGRKRSGSRLYLMDFHT